MSADAAQRPAWSSSVAFYLVTVGASVGLGSIWRFPYLAGTSGGSAFILVFVAACLLIATPLLVAEFILGRRSRRSPPEAAAVVARESGRTPGWNAIGILGTVGAFVVMTYYTLIAGWVMAYTWRCANGSLSGLSNAKVTRLWDDFLAQPLQLGAWHLAFVVLVTCISARGVNRGIELANRVRAPVLLLLMLVLAGYSLAKGDVARGLSFAFAPNFGAITPSVILAAIGQAFYATGVGMAMMIAYGAYLERGTSLVRSSLIISSAILIVSLLATVIVFPLVFRYGMNPSHGVHLVFDVLASVFAEMPGGRLVGTLFFLMLVFAALTPSLAGIEPIIAWLVDRHGWSRPRAVIATTASIWLVGIASMLSFNLLRGWHPLEAVPGFAGRTVFDASDYLVSNIILPVGALMTTIFVGWRVMDRVVQDELADSSAFARRAIVISLRYVCPIALAAVLVANLA